MCRWTRLDCPTCGIVNPLTVTVCPACAGQAHPSHVHPKET